MKLLLVHNRYRQEGGEDHVFAAEGALLEAHGHDVVRYVEDNERIGDDAGVATALGAVWNAETYRVLKRLVRRERPDVAHFHNTFPLVSPAGYYAAASERVSVVQTLHNYRLLCPMAQLFRDGRPCEDCVGRRFAWPGVLHACYRGSRAATAAVATMLAAHGALGTWRRRVDRYIAQTEFARAAFVRGGLPEDRLRVKPNFLDRDPGVGEGAGGYALYVGRLAPEKGIGTLLEAWGFLGREMPLKIVGDGPLAPAVATAGGSGVTWLGRRTRDEVHALMREALVLVVPSRWYESCPLVVLEAFAAGLPVVTSDLGALAEIVDHGRTGLRFPASDAGALAEQVRRLAGNPEERGRMRRAARAEYEAKYTAEINHDRLVAIYREARGLRAAKPPSVPAAR